MKLCGFERLFRAVRAAQCVFLHRLLGDVVLKLRKVGFRFFKLFRKVNIIRRDLFIRRGHRSRTVVQHTVLCIDIGFARSFKKPAEQRCDGLCVRPSGGDLFAGILLHFEIAVTAAVAAVPPAVLRNFVITEEIPSISFRIKIHLHFRVGIVIGNIIILVVAAVFAPAYDVGKARRHRDQQHGNYKDDLICDRSENLDTFVFP